MKMYQEGDILQLGNAYVVGQTHKVSLPTCANSGMIKMCRGILQIKSL